MPDSLERKYKMIIEKLQKDSGLMFTDNNFFDAFIALGSLLGDIKQENEKEYIEAVIENLYEINNVYLKCRKDKKS